MKPHSAGPATARAGMPSANAATGRVTTAPASICTTVTATGSRPARTPGCATTYAADATADANISASPLRDDPPPDRATRPTPAIATTQPTHDCDVDADRPRAVAMRATSAGTAPRINAACVTLVRPIAPFCSATPKP